jgi:uncharacterized membrane protein
MALAMTSLQTANRRRGLTLLAVAVLAALALAAATPGAANQSPAFETVGQAGVVGSDPWSKAYRPRRAPADSSGGFVYRNGKYTPLRVIPGAARVDNAPVPGTAVAQTHFAINDRGETAGIYADKVGDDGRVPPGSAHGFVRSRRGRVTSFEVPGTQGDILVKGNNNRGQVVGEYVDTGAAPGPDRLLPPGSVHGFIRQQSGRITTFDVPFPYLHDVADINDRFQIVGYYDDPDRPYNLEGGFLREPDGEIVRLEVPGALSTTPRCINNKGQVVGSYVDAGAEPNPDGTIPQGVIHGFVWHKGRYTTFDPAGSVYTVPTGCNDRGQITGGYQDARGKEHGFLLTRGRTTTLDAPGRVDNIAWGINNRGQVVIPEAGVRLGYQVATP